MKIKFMLIPKLEKLWNMIHESNGNVYLELSETQYLDLKKEKSAYEQFKKEVEKNQGIKLFLSDSKDHQSFLNYMVGAAYD